MKKGFFFIFIAFLFLVSCENTQNGVDAYNADNEDCSQAAVNRQAYSYLKDWYLWYEHLPEIDPAEYATLDEMISAVKYREGDKLIDRFSYSLLKSEHEDYYAGKRYGMGYSWIRDNENNLYFSMVYPGSPAYSAGLRRGQRVLAMNDVTVEELDENEKYNKAHKNDADFEEKTDWENVYNPENKGEAVKFRILDHGTEVETTVYLDDYISKSVLASAVLEDDGVKTGYVHLKSFISPSEGELNEVFAEFKKEKVEMIVLDLRYNGGGLVKIAELLVNLIAGSRVKNENIIKILYNDKHSDKNSVYKGKKLDNSLDEIKKVGVIVSSGTASASEMVINSLKPFVQTVLIGKTTYGKPVGMNAKDICDQTIVPITFKYANSEDYGDFFLGMEADCNSEDDFKHDFGDPEEDGLKNTLYYLKNNECPAGTLTKKDRKRRNIMEMIPGKLKGAGKIDYTF